MAGGIQLPEIKLPDSIYETYYYQRKLYHFLFWKALQIVQILPKCVLNYILKSYCKNTNNKETE